MVQIKSGIHVMLFVSIMKPGLGVILRWHLQIL